MATNRREQSWCSRRTASREIPVDTVRAAADAAYLIVNAAPAATLDDELLARIGLLVVNEHEAAVVSGVAGVPSVTGPRCWTGSRRSW